MVIGTLTLLVFTLLLANPTRSVAAPSYDYIWEDNFDGFPLHPLWSWVREDPTHWSLIDRPGFLRITTQRGFLYGSGGDAKNLLLQSAPVRDFEIRTRVFFTPTANFHFAGLLIYDDDDNCILLNRGFCSFHFGSGIYFDSEVSGSTTTISTTASITDTYLRIEKAGAVYTAYYSPDGSNWTTLGSHTNNNLAPSKIGLVAADNNPPELWAPEILADFDFFQLAANYQKVFLPLVLKGN